MENRADYPLDTNELWKKHCLFHFPGRRFNHQQQGNVCNTVKMMCSAFQMWRDTYFALTRENEQKVKNITQKMGMAVTEIIRQKDLKQTKYVVAMNCTRSPDLQNLKYCFSAGTRRKKESEYEHDWNQQSTEAHSVLDGSSEVRSAVGQDEESCRRKGPEVSGGNRPVQFKNRTILSIRIKSLLTQNRDQEHLVRQHRAFDSSSFIRVCDISTSYYNDFTLKLQEPQFHQGWYTGHQLVYAFSCSLKSHYCALGSNLPVVVFPVQPD